MKKVLVIGAGLLQAFVIKKARELGYYTLCVDANPNAEGFSYADEYAVIDIVNQKACYTYAREKMIDGVLTAATDYGVLTMSYIAQKMGLPGINYDAALRIKNKFRVRECLYEAGLEDTDLSFEVSEEVDIDKYRTQVKYPVMVKPCDSSGSRGASRVDSSEDFSKACRFAMDQSLSHCATVERFIDGVEYGAESFVVNGNVHVLGVMRKWMTKPPYYAELGHSIPSCLSYDMEAKVRRCVEKAIHALNIEYGAVNMDLLISADGGVHIIDVGARMGGNLIGSHIIPIGTGVQYIENMIAATVGDSFDFSPKFSAKCVATRLLALTPGIVRRMPNIEAIEQKNNVEIVHHLEVGSCIHEYHNNLDGCGYIVAKSDEYENAVINASNALIDIDRQISREEKNVK